MAWRAAGQPHSAPGSQCRCSDRAPPVWKQYFGTSTRLVQRKVRSPTRAAARQQILIQSVAEVTKPRATFATVQSQDEFFAILEAGVAAKKIPQQLMLAFKDFYNNYKSTFTTASLRLICNCAREQNPAGCLRPGRYLALCLHGCQLLRLQQGYDDLLCMRSCRAGQRGARSRSEARGTGDGSHCGQSDRPVCQPLHLPVVPQAHPGAIQLL